MYISYGLAIVLISLLSVILWLMTRWSLEKSVIGGLVLFVPTVPAVALFSRVLWIYLDQAVDPDESRPIARPKSQSGDR